MEERTQDLKQRLLVETRADLLKRQLSNAENYDKAILSLSTAFLGLSFVFMKDIVPVHQAKWLLLLYGSWGLLTCAVLTTIVSFWVSQSAIDQQLKKAEDYYIRGDQAALTKGLFARATDCLNVASGGFFILGVSLTTIFIVGNFERGSSMSDKKSEKVNIREAAPIPRMQEAPIEKGAPIPDLQQVPANSPPQSAPPSQGTPSAPSVPSGGSKQ